MAINFNVGDIIVVKQTYLKNSLAFADPVIPEGTRTFNIKRTLSLLGALKHDTSEVLAKGTVQAVTDEGNPVTRSYITIRPENQQASSYQSGQGIIIYWEDDTTINDMFELSTAFVKDSQSIRVLNNSGTTIFKGAVVYTDGFDMASNLPTVALASASSSTTLAPFGLAEQEMVNGAFGTVIIDGHFQGLDTLAFNINDIVYLSDTPGQISATQGTSPSIVGRVINVGASDGAIAFRGIIPLGQGVGGGGPGPMGSTGIQGVTGIQGATGFGATGIQGLQGNQGATGFGGPTGLVGPTGVEGPMGMGTTGVQGMTGIQGVTGVIGLTGMFGETGIKGCTGVYGETGIQGITGFLGDTGIQGFTGIGAGGSAFVRDTFTGSVTNGQTAFTLSMTPGDVTHVAFEVNGVVYRDTTYISVSGTSLTWNDVFSLSASDVVIAFYPS